MADRKAFVYLVRRDGPSPELLVFESLDEPGLEVPKGALEPGETFEEAGVREVFEEAGIGGIRILRRLGVRRYEEEQQTFLLAEAPERLPVAFEHTVTGDGIDAGLRYVFRWEPIDATLRDRLVQGCDALIEELLGALHRS
jgi:8-oxo-dGTP pyrophosphatase MutT (NUDIX family)